MAEEKKPKIDLKARLGKGAPTPTPAPVGCAPAAAASQPAVPPPGVSGPGLPVPPGVPVGAAAARSVEPARRGHGAARQSLAPQMPAQPQRIEVDEMARPGGHGKARDGLVFAGIALVMARAVGFVGGQAKETGNGRAQRASKTPKELKTDVDAAQGKLEDLASKLEAGREQLTRRIRRRRARSRRISPTSSARSTSTSTAASSRVAASAASRRTRRRPLFDFVTSVQALNDHKTRGQEPAHEAREAPHRADRSGARPARDPVRGARRRQHAARIPAATTTATSRRSSRRISFTRENPRSRPSSRRNFSGPERRRPQVQGRPINEPAAIYVDAGQLRRPSAPARRSRRSRSSAIKLGDLIHEIRGEAKPARTRGRGAKPGLLERADKLSKGLEKVAHRRREADALRARARRPHPAARLRVDLGADVDVAAQQERACARGAVGLRRRRRGAEPPRCARGEHDDAVPAPATRRRAGLGHDVASLRFGSTRTAALRPLGRRARRRREAAADRRFRRSATSFGFDVGRRVTPRRPSSPRTAETTSTFTTRCLVGLAHGEAAARRCSARSCRAAARARRGG